MEDINQSLRIQQNREREKNTFGVKGAKYFISFSRNSIEGGSVSKTMCIPNNPGKIADFLALITKEFSGVDFNKLEIRTEYDGRFYITGLVNSTESELIVTDDGFDTTDSDR